LPIFQETGKSKIKGPHLVRAIVVEAVAEGGRARKSTLKKESLLL
jgi:hypothetical protein